MRMLDLFCGRFGWSKAFAERGWECIGIDIASPPNEKPANCIYLQWDIAFLNDLRDYKADFICASSPCEQFSTLLNFRPPVPYPELGIKLFNHTRAICEASGVPYVMENVAGAGKHVGRAVRHCGPYYLWGSGVPPILPQGISKGMTALAMGLREHKGKPGWDVRHGKKGQTPTAHVATIPHELSACVADYAERLLEMRATA